MFIIVNYGQIFRINEDGLSKKVLNIKSKNKPPKRPVSRSGRGRDKQVYKFPLGIENAKGH
jgi:hypothetical protein